MYCSNSSHHDSIMSDMLAGQWYCRSCDLPPVGMFVLYIAYYYINIIIITYFYVYFIATQSMWIMRFHVMRKYFSKYSILL